jgi:catechol 2,3-dioxygenase-like lactoylglutathione lyase family enzyme
MASVRYIVNDIDESVSFYRDRLGFAVEMHNPGKFAALKLEDPAPLSERAGCRQRWQGRR